MQKFDAIVVGGGPGGYECAIRLSQNGLKTALVEEAELGDTCLNRGCIPTKTLLHSADIYHDAKNGAPFGVSADNVTFDYAKIIERKNAVSKQLSNGVAFLEKSHGVTVFADHATLTDRQTVHLAGGEDLTCDHLIVATGSSPARIPVPGVDLPGVVDSTGLLNMTTCPKHIIIVGGGVIGVEFATFFYRLGVPVTIDEMLTGAGAPGQGCHQLRGSGAEVLRCGAGAGCEGGVYRGRPEGPLRLCQGWRQGHCGGRRGADGRAAEPPIPGALAWTPSA